LKEMSLPQFRRFGATIVALIGLDQQIDLFEWVLHRVLIRDLQPHFGAAAGRSAGRHGSAGRTARPRSMRARPLGQNIQAAATLLSALAREQAPGADPQVAFRAGLAAAGITADFDAAADRDFARLGRALAELRQLPPLQKPRLIKACAATVLADGRISPRQGALLQGVAAALDCPLPPSIHSGWSAGWSTGRSPG
jgi:hypothetical protein